MSTLPRIGLRPLLQKFALRQTPHEEIKLNSIVAEQLSLKYEADISFKYFCEQESRQQRTLLNLARIRILQT